MQKHPTLGLIEYFKDLPDPRVNRTKDHALIDLLVISVCTLLCGGESFNDMEDFGHAKEEWFRSFLTLTHGIPSHDTFNRVFAALDPRKFLDCFLRWTQSLRQSVHQEIVALDGKALRRLTLFVCGQKRKMCQGACPRPRQIRCFRDFLVHSPPKAVRAAEL